MKNLNITIGSEYLVDPKSIRFDQEFVEFNRVHTSEEYESTLLSIKKIGQQEPIHINNITGLCENGRHRVKICEQLNIQVKCIQVDGTLNKDERILFYNKDITSGRDLTVSQKAIQAHKYSLISKEKLSICAKMFNVRQREISAANAIAGLNRHDIFLEIMNNGYWINNEGKKMKSLRTIESYIKMEQEKVEEIKQQTEFDYTDLINTEKGKVEFWKLRNLVKLSEHDLHLALVELMNLKYKLIEENVKDF